MKKIVLLALMALMLCVQHESHAMYRQVARNIGQQCAQRWNQQIAPAYRTAISGARQQLSNLGSQTSQQFRNMRNWSQKLNLPSMRTSAALGLGGAGLTTAAYLQRPGLFGVVGAEEETEVLQAVTQEKIATENLPYDPNRKMNEVRMRGFAYLEETPKCWIENNTVNSSIMHTQPWTGQQEFLQKLAHVEQGIIKLEQSSMVGMLGNDEKFWTVDPNSGYHFVWLSNYGSDFIKNKNIKPTKQFYDFITQHPFLQKGIAEKVAEEMNQLQSEGKAKLQELRAEEKTIEQKYNRQNILQTLLQKYRQEQE